jgi:hypothetical protein
MDWQQLTSSSTCLVGLGYGVLQEILLLSRLVKCTRHHEKGGLVPDPEWSGSYLEPVENHVTIGFLGELRTRTTGGIVRVRERQEALLPVIVFIYPHHLIRQAHRLHRGHMMALLQGVSG